MTTQRSPGFDDLDPKRIAHSFASRLRVESIGPTASCNGLGQGGEEEEEEERVVVEEESMLPGPRPLFRRDGSWQLGPRRRHGLEATSRACDDASPLFSLHTCSLFAPRPALLLGALAPGGSRSRRPGLKLGVEMEWSRWACSSHSHHVNSVITTACALHRRISSLCGSASEPQSAGQSSEGPTVKPGRATRLAAGGWR